VRAGERIPVIEGDCLQMLAAEVACARFARPRRVVSDTCWNGGFQIEAEAVANHQMRPEEVQSAQAFQQYCRDLLGLHQLPATTVLQLTAARLLDGGLGREDGGGFPVTALVTAGVSHNAVWAGDAAGYEEVAAGEYQGWAPGTINSMIFIDADVACEAMLHGFTVVAECKADEILRRGIRSHYSDALATGTGTDTTTIVCNPFSLHKRATASTHSRLGMAIARAVRSALSQALAAGGQEMAAGGDV